MDRLVFGMHHLNITQAGTILDGKQHYSHPNAAIDLAGEDSGIDYWYNKESETYFYCSGYFGNRSTGNTRFFVTCDKNGQKKKVLCADGKERVITLALTHSGKDYQLYHVYKPGDILYQEGTAGRATGNHIHLEIAEGSQKTKYWDVKMKVYRMMGEMDPRNAFFILDGYTKVVNTQGLIFKHCSKVNVEEKLMGLGFKAHKAETQKIIDAHKKDFNANTVKSFLASKGGYKAYLKSLGGIFAKYVDFTGKITTYDQLSEIGDYVWGLYDIWGVDYSNGCSYTYSENIYKAYAKDGSQFYPKEDPKARFKVNYSAFSFANGNDLPGIDEMLSNPDKYYAVTNCGQGVVQTLKKAGLCPKGFPDPAEYPEYWKTNGHPYTLIKNSNELKVGDVLYFFNKKIPNRGAMMKLSNWADGGFHTAIVGERASDSYTLYDSGHAYTYYGEFRNQRKFTDKPYQWAEDWIGLRFNFGLSDKIDINKYNDVELAKMVWEGKFGSGEDRKKALGPRYKIVQELVELGENKLKDILSQPVDSLKLVKLAQYQIGNKGDRYWDFIGEKNEWCSEFVAYTAYCLGFVKDGRMPKVNECGKAHNFYSPKGLLHKKSGYSPKPGDIAYFGDGGTLHTSIVKSFDGKTLKTIDGNQYVDSTTWRNSVVKECSFNINDNYVWGFANPLTKGESVANGWKKENNKWYFYDNGVLVKGWKKIKWSKGLDWFWFDKDGVMAIGWKKINWNNKDCWFYFDTNGAMATGWQKLKWSKGESWFYFTADGTMITGLQHLEWKGVRSWYLFDENGAMQVGKVKMEAEFSATGTLKSGKKI